jgi:hypothetical protein
LPLPLRKKIPTFSLAVFVPPPLQDIHKLNTSLNSGSNAEYVTGAKFAFCSAAIAYWAAVRREATGNCDIKCGMELEQSAGNVIFCFCSQIDTVSIIGT